ncbi:MAG: hypothetical protein IPL61_06840 [Myxococcales bacterium]|nr:hypothetical protein [Myxococcales bacterium]
MRITAISAILLALGAGAGCSDDPKGVDPATAPRHPIDRFSAAAGTVFVRDADPSLPAADAAIDYDATFKMDVLGPGGEAVALYLFDVQPTTPAPIYVLFREGENGPVDGQKNIVTVVPGMAGYNDLWQPIRVDVPGDYVANTITSYAEIVARGLTLTPMPALVNCPLVPEGSVARVRTPGDYAELSQAWYDDKIVHYFHFGERPSLAPAGDLVPTSTIYVAYDINPTAGAPVAGKGFATEAGSALTHNVVAALPGDTAYSPLWSVQVYDRAAFDSVVDLASAQAAPAIATAGANLNAPIVRVTP